MEFEGHLASPGETVALEVHWTQRCDHRQRCLVERTVGEGAAERIWSTRDAAWSENQRYTAEEADAHRRLVELVMPREAERGKARQTLDYCHPRLGDARDVATYEGWASASGVEAPTKVTLSHHGTDASFEAELALIEAKSVDALDPPTPPDAPSVAAPDIRSLEPRIWDVRLPLHDARSFVFELDEGLLVFEAPWSSAAGEQVVDLIQGKLEAPIRYVTFSHHHPHYTGGLRAFMAAGATVVVHEALAPFVQSIAALPFGRRPDRLATARRAPKVKTFRDEIELGTGPHRWILHDIGAHSHHTDHYTVLWSPERHVLVEGDIGWFVEDDGSIRTNKRSAGLLTAIDERGWTPERMLQSWPVRTQEPQLPFARLRAAVRE